MTSSATCEDVLEILLLEYKDNNSPPFRQWFMQQFAKNNLGHSCCLEEFAEYFLNSLRKNTEKHLKVKGGRDTPNSKTSVRTLKPSDDVSRPQDDESNGTPQRVVMQELQHQQTSTPNKNHSTNENLHNSSAARYVDMSQMFGDASDGGGSHSMPSLMNTSMDRPNNSQKQSILTPIKKIGSNNSPRLSSTPTSSICLGDFIVLNKSTNNRSNKKKNNSGTLGNTKKQAAQQQVQEKPTKRVQPINVAKKTNKSNQNLSSVFDGKSSVSQDNNLLHVSNAEVDDKDQCSILEARKLLKTNKKEITKEFTESPVKITANTATAEQNQTLGSSAEELPLNLENIHRNKRLKILANIYVVLLDLNLTTSLLNELSFLLNLLNATITPIETDLNDEFDKLEIQNEEKSIQGLDCLLDLKYAICFSIHCLNELKSFLAILDLKTLNVIINNGRFCCLKDNVRSYLLEVYQQKHKLMVTNKTHDTYFCFAADKKACGNVHFQEDVDSRQNFSSNHEFGNYRVQRDLFYHCLKIWEINHMTRNWKFSIEIGPFVRNIFQQSELFINMTHFAHLFVSQLLLSASNAPSPETIGLGVNMQKLNKLTQRMIEPGQFSMDYQFPREQAFFRDFILQARSVAFLEQLKMELYSELISLKDSSFEHINVTKASGDKDNHEDSFIACFSNDHIAVRPDILNSMLILAKFLGFTISLPYIYSADNTMYADIIIPTAVEKKQIALRTLTQPNFDLYNIVQKDIQDGKLLITIPWMVQYLSMQDSITLQLEINAKVLRLLFALNWYLTRDGANILTSTTKFIITACLGWLFDSKQILTEQYYHFCLKQTTKTDEISEELAQVINKLEKFKQESVVCTDDFRFNPVLEALLPVACPFLGEFRASILSAKYDTTKYTSRGKRYMHLTTIAAQAPDGIKMKTSELDNTTKAIQQKLVKAFFHSQNASTRQLINFCSERCYKSVVRDGQLKILLPAKSKADAEVNKIKSCSYKIVYNEINVIYQNAHKQACEKWNASETEMLDNRIKMALDSLLPEETPLILKKAYFMIIKNNAKANIKQWFYDNIIKDNYFCVDLECVANKVCNANTTTKHPSELKILQDTPSLPELLGTLQYWLHCTSVRTELYQDTEPIIDLLHGFMCSFSNELPTTFYSLLKTYTIQLLQNILINKHYLLTSDLIEAACLLWQKIIDNDPDLTSINYNYDGLVTVAFIRSLNGRAECYSKFAELIISMIKKRVISINYANDLFLPIFKYDWPPQEFDEISNLLRNIAQATSSDQSARIATNHSDEEDDNEKCSMFMDMLADLSRDIGL